MHPHLTEKPLASTLCKQPCRHMTRAHTMNVVICCINSDPTVLRKASGHTDPKVP